MKIPEAQLVYVILLLPALFSLAFLSEGLHKIFRGDSKGFLHIVVSAIILLGTFAAYLYLQQSLPGF